MKNDTRKEYVTRDAILKLLSDEEIARVGMAETAAGLADGDEYVDLEGPDRGVRRAPGQPTAPMGRVIPRKAVHERTWREIETLLAAHRNAARAPTH
jgi:hypothetical protein